MEIVGICFGCPMSSESRDRITAAFFKVETAGFPFSDEGRAHPLRTHNGADLNQESIRKTTRSKSGSGKSFSYAHRSVKLMR
jgi:hypothetical protein